MMTSPRLRFFSGALALVGAISLTACGSNGSGAASIDLSPAAAEGQSLSRSNGCGSCHGTSGQGGVGPAFVGLYGSEVELDDGSVITADREYLIESIKDPSAKQVGGFRLPMPTNNLSDDEIDQIVTYIEALATPTEGATP